MAKADSTVPTLNEGQLSRFWSYVDRSGDCWLWTRGLTRAGYGVFHPSHGVSLYAHRLAWLLANGPIPGGVEVCHNCPGGDKPACCNPAHLFLATHADNLRDAFAKGRMARRDANPVCKGSRHGMAELTEDAVRSMRAEYAAGGVSQRALARKHGITQANVWAIINRKTWGHVEP